MSKFNITILSEQLVLHGILDSSQSNSSIGILFLHGGGNSSAQRYGDVQTYFSDKNITSLAFSFRGCGSSDGVFEQSNLNDRLVDAESALKTFKQTTGLSDHQIFIWGSSMGGHIACRLVAGHKEIKGLILQSAAAYGQAAESQPFGPKFTNAINLEQNWQDSRAFSDLATFPNPTLILYGQNDSTIPTGVKELFNTSAKYPNIFIIPGYGHKMLRPNTQLEKVAWDKMVDSALIFMQNK